MTVENTLDGTRQRRAEEVASAGAGDGPSGLEERRDQARSLFAAFDKAIQKALPANRERFASSFRQEIGE